MISVCLASYNGEKYISGQLDSILKQLAPNDELIISDDGSIDNTEACVMSISDKRIQFIKNEGRKGPVGNFENALRHAKGDYIFLADQDDIWLPGRVERTIERLSQKDVECVICNRIIIDKEGKSNNKPIVVEDFTKLSFNEVLLHNPYIGCCMAFTRKHLELVLPFPKNLPMHDLWIGLLAHKLKKVSFVSDPLIGYRRHGENVTTGKSPFSIFYRVLYRLSLLKHIYQRLHR